MGRFIAPETKRPRGASKGRGIFVAILASAAAVALGASGAGVTFAFLNASAPGTEVSVKAGTFGIRIGDGTNTPLPAKKLSPALPATWAFTVTNTGDAPATLAAQISATGGPAYAGKSRASLTPVTNADACATDLAGTALLNGYTNPTLGSLAAGETKTYCLVVSLPNTTSAAGSGSSHSFTLTIDAVQKEA